MRYSESLILRKLTLILKINTKVFGLSSTIRDMNLKEIRRRVVSRFASSMLVIKLISLILIKDYLLRALVLRYKEVTINTSSSLLVTRLYYLPYDFIISLPYIKSDY